MSSSEILSAKSLEKTYKIARPFRKSLELKAVRDVSFSLKAGETLAIVGESGCGKSTLGKLLLGLENLSSGEIKHTSRIQMIFQDPSSSLNPRQKVFDLVAEPLRILKISEKNIRSEVVKACADVGLSEEYLNRYPHMMSGGQKQRVGIARALVTHPEILICDEPVSALDVSVQAQVLNLLKDLREKKNLSYIFISHDLGVVKFIADRVAVLYLGKIVEMGTVEQIFNSPQHPYTRLLLQSSPHHLKNRIQASEVINGEIPSPLNPPQGCAFRSRCSFNVAECESQPILEIKNGSAVACFSVSPKL